MENVIDAIRGKSHIRFSVVIGMIMGLACFLLIGISTDVIQTNKFTRMVPAGIIEMILLIAFSVLLGVYAGTLSYAYLTNHSQKNKRPIIGSISKGTVGSFGSWFAISCPTCIAFLVSIFGSAALMKYYDPVRPYLGVLSIGLISLGIRNNFSMINGRCRTCRVRTKKSK